MPTAMISDSVVRIRRVVRCDEACGRRPGRSPRRRRPPPPDDDRAGALTSSTSDAEATAELLFLRQPGPARTIVSTADGTWVATFTDGARTVTLAGRNRTFREPAVSATVGTACGPGC
jgi:hypothetical protein